MALRMLFPAKPTLYPKGEYWWSQKEIQDRAGVLWPDESPVEQAGFRCLWLPLIAVSSSALGLVTWGFAEGKFSERIFLLNYFLYLSFPHFCDLMNVFLIPESGRREAVGFLLLGDKLVTLELVQSNSCFTLGEWDVVLLCVWRKL